MECRHEVQWQQDALRGRSEGLIGAEKVCVLQRHWAMRLDEDMGVVSGGCMWDVRLLCQNYRF